MPTRVNVSVQFEVVFPPEEFLAHLALEPAPAAVGGQVTSQVALTRKHLVREDGVKVIHCHPLSSQGRFQPSWPTMAGSVLTPPGFMSEAWTEHSCSEPGPNQPWPKSLSLSLSCFFPSIPNTGLERQYSG